jgi:hypothetical protein
MKRSRRIFPFAITMAFSATLLTFAVAAPAIAQMTPHAVGKMDNYLDSHPGVARQLQANPSLIDNKNFVANHPGLHEFLENHPNVREQWKASAARSGYHGPYAAYGHHETATTDEYLDHHPEVARDLKNNPGLIDNQQYVDSHPGLHEFLHTHPNIRHNFKEHPYRFEKREQNYEHHEGAHN